MQPDRRPRPMLPAEGIKILLRQDGWSFGSARTIGPNGRSHHDWGVREGKGVRGTESEAWRRAYAQVQWIEVLDLAMVGKG